VNGTFSVPTNIERSLAPAPPARIVDRSQIDFDTRELSPDYDSDDEYESGSVKYQHYRSEKILGKLYRAIDEKRIWAEDIRLHEVSKNGSSVWEEFLARATAQCQRYGVLWKNRTTEARQLRAT